MHKLAGMRVDPKLNGFHGRHGGTSPRLVRVDTGETTPLDLPAGSEVHDVSWTADGLRFALTVGQGDQIGLWVGSVDGQVKKIETVALNPLLGTPVEWLPDQQRLLVRRIPPGRGPAPHTLYWVEALDGGDPVAEVPHRDRLMRLGKPFSGEPEEVFRAEHRIQPWGSAWGAEGGTLMLSERERIRRWRYVWLLDVDAGTARRWFDLDEDDRYGDPGFPLERPLANGKMVMHQQGDAVYFRGSGATAMGDRPFLDLRPLGEGATERLFRSAPDRYEVPIAVIDDDRLVIRSESSVDVPNYFVAALGDTTSAGAGEAMRTVTREPITHIEDPAPRLRQIEKRIVRYERADGVPLSFTLGATGHLAPPPPSGARRGGRGW